MWILMGLCLILLGICAYTDLRHREVPLSLPVIFIVLAVLYRGAEGIWWQGFTELLLRLVPGVTLLLIHLLKRQWIGAGDGLLVTVCGYALGSEMILKTVMIAFLCSGCFGLTMLILKRYDRKDTLPFVPFLLTGFLGACVFWIVREISAK